MSPTPSRPILILGNIIAITITIAALAQAISWTIAGILILVSLILPLLVNITPPKAQLTHAVSMISSSSHQTNTEMRPQHKSTEKPLLSSRQSITKTELKQHPKQHPGTAVASDGASPRSSEKESSPTRMPPLNQGPDLNPTIAKDDYVEYEVELDVEENFLGEVAADGLTNVYLLDEENMDNLDEGEEFWSETGEEGVEAARLEFTAPSEGTWFFVVENADDRAITATVKMQKGPISTTRA